MTDREQLIQEIEQVPDFLVREVLNFLLFLKTKMRWTTHPEESQSLHTNQAPSFLNFIDQLNEEISTESDVPLPNDFAQNLDHYLYGSPKE